MLHPSVPLRIIAAAVCLCIALPVFAATYYIAPDGSDTNAGTAAQPWKTLTRAFQQGGGHTYVLKNGTYDYTGMDITAPPSGTAAAYTVVKAENDGSALIRRPIHINSPATSYVRFEGLRWKANAGKQIVGHHLKFLRCTFEDGPLTATNDKNTNVGRIEDSPGATSDILLEDCVFFGRGGRYELLVFNATRVVVRRAVIRHDGGWPGHESDPEAGIVFYNSTHCVAQNVIVLDSLGTYVTWIAAIMAVHMGNPETLATANLTYKGCIALATKGSGFSAEGVTSISGLTIEDSVFWDNLGAGIVFNSQSNPSTVVKNVTIGNSRYTATNRGIARYSGTSVITVKNAIVTAKNDAFQSVSPTYYDCWNTGACNGSTTGRQTYNPFLNGLLHLQRIEPGSNLAQHGEGGGRIGANVTTKIGVSGTLHGETGWNVDTGEALWPWPYEARVRAEMCASTSTGFCASPSLTDYVCSYLGNSCTTADTQPPTVPANVVATAESPSQIRLDWSASTDDVGVSGYRVDVSTSAAFDTFVTGYQNRDAGNVTTFAVTGLNASTTYYARVRAYDATPNVSASSTPASATTHAASSTTTRVIAVGATWKYFKGTAAPPASWNALAFDDASWLSGPTGIGYGDGDDATVLSDMQNNYVSVFARKTFDVGAPASVAGLSLTIDWDDGYVAYLNGTEVARANVSSTAHNAVAAAFREAGTPVVVDLSSFRNLLVAGTNVLAIQVHNDDVASSDLSLKPALDLRIPEVVVAIGASWTYFKGTAAPAALWKALAFDDATWLSGPTGIGYGDGDDATVLSDMQNGYAAVYVRRAFTIADAAAVTRLALTIDFDDGYVAYLNGTEVARSNMPAGTPTHTTLATPFHEAGTPVTVDLTAHRTLLVTGTNVLAIEIHNDDVASSDLSLIPALTIER